MCGSAKLHRPVFQTLQLYSLKKCFQTLLLWIGTVIYLYFIESEVTSPMLFHETEDCLVLNTCFVTLPCGWKLLSGYPYVKYLSCHYCKSRLVVDVADPHWLKETYDLLPNFY